MKNSECKFCLHFNKYYKIKNCKLVEVEGGECEMNLTLKTDKNCPIFILADKFRGKRTDSIVSLLEDINKSLLAIKESIDDSALAEKYDKEYKRNNM